MVKENQNTQIDENVENQILDDQNDLKDID